MKYKLFLFKEGKEEQWRKWCAYLNLHHHEVIETMQEEKLTREFCILHDKVLLYGIVGESLPANKNKLINIMHSKHKHECLESYTSNEDFLERAGEVLFDFNIA
jgi:hypothetical protein